MSYYSWLLNEPPVEPEVVEPIKLWIEIEGTRYECTDVTPTECWQAELTLTGGEITSLLVINADEVEPDPDNHSCEVEVSLCSFGLQAKLGFFPSIGFVVEPDNDSWIEIEGTRYECIDINPGHESWPTELTLEGGEITSILVAEDYSDAEEMVLNHYRDMMHDDPRELWYLCGEDVERLVDMVNNINDGYPVDEPEGLFGIYDGCSVDISNCSPQLENDLGFLPGVGFVTDK